MNIGMYRAVAGCIVQQERLDAASMNMANSSTIGYKAIRLSVGFNNDVVQVDRKSIDFTEGGRQDTRNKLDLALDGDGFFVVQTSRGPAYTRKGNFSLNAQGELVTQEGMPVLGQNGPVKITGHDIHISADGTIRADGRRVDKLRLATFRRPYPFDTRSGSLFFPDPATGAQEEPAKGAVVQQGQIELSNVNLMKEMVRLIEISTSYESCQKVIQTVDEMDQKIINETNKM
ncbi:MAG: flagellar hook-basal body protein [bacterium]|nr:flagellar hook-basal body protein [bacterium]